MQNLSVISNAFLQHFPFATVSCVDRESVFNDVKSIHELTLNTKPCWGWDAYLVTT